MLLDSRYNWAAPPQPNAREWNPEEYAQWSWCRGCYNWFYEFRLRVGWLFPCIWFRTLVCWLLHLVVPLYLVVFPCIWLFPCMLAFAYCRTSPMKFSKWSRDYERRVYPHSYGWCVPCWMWWHREQQLRMHTVTPLPWHMLQIGRRCAIRRPGAVQDA